MDKEEILEKSRKENKNVDLPDSLAIEKGSQIAMAIGILLCGVVNLVDVLVIGKINYSIWAIFMGMEAALFTYKYIKLKKKHELLVSLLFITFTVCFAVLYGLTLGGVIK